MVLSWILRSLSPSIAQSILWIDNAMDVWKDLYNRFSQDYFTQLKILWDEYLNLRMVPVCSCNPQCHCDALKIVKDHQEAQANISYKPYRPPPMNSSANKSYRPPMNSFGGSNNTRFRPQGGQKRFYTTSNNGKPICSYCGMSGHIVDICFKKYRSPPGYKSKYRPQTCVNQVGELVTIEDHENAYSFEQEQGYDSNDVYGVNESTG
ncbi:conserved hypothetical protein [Ricinus communis]|uniref:Retrotransposon gag domain-containing protein n=1 Tax=Ricinus communis TaxID=3988 RepID=B9T196_RICCO|nr:conserved hypothetical protein [Ricinus communis]